MHRRALLRRIAGLGALAGVGTASGHPGAEGSAGTDTTPSGSDIGPHSRLPMEAAREAVVGDDGTVAYVATMTGFAAVDVADPHDPQVLAAVDEILADHEDGPLVGIQDLKVDGDDLLIVGPANGGGPLNAAVLYDVSDPADPAQVGVHETEYFLHNCYLREGTAYLPGNGLDGEPLVIVDMGEDPEELGRWSLFAYDDAWRDMSSSLYNLHDLWVQGDVAYLAQWDAGTFAVDVSDPTDPTLIARVRGRDPSELPTEPRYAVLREAVTPPGNDHYVTTNDDGTLLGIGSESWAFQGSGGPSGITFYDVSDPADPEERGHIEHPPTDEPAQTGVWTTAHNFQLTDGYCYSAWYQGGVKIHDVSDPDDPVEEYHWRESDAARFWTAELAVEGQSFIAPSMGVPGAMDATPEGGDAPEGAPALYIFPDVVHERPDATPTPRGDSSGAFGPGFGVGAAVASALGAGAWWAHRNGSAADDDGDGKR